MSNTNNDTNAAVGSTNNDSNIKDGNQDINPTTKQEETNRPTLSLTNNEQEEQIHKEQKLKSEYILNKKQSQFNSASKTLSIHSSKLNVISLTQDTIDDRLLELRKRWRLSVPNHGVHVSYPIQPCDVIAVDVWVGRERGGGSMVKRGRIWYSV